MEGAMENGAMRVRVVIGSPSLLKWAMKMVPEVRFSAGPGADISL